MGVKRKWEEKKMERKKIKRKENEEKKYIFSLIVWIKRKEKRKWEKNEKYVKWHIYPCCIIKYKYVILLKF